MPRADVSYVLDVLPREKKVKERAHIHVVLLAVAVMTIVWPLLM